MYCNRHFFRRYRFVAALVFALKTILILKLLSFKRHCAPLRQPDGYNFWKFVFCLFQALFDNFFFFSAAWWSLRSSCIEENSKHIIVFDATFYELPIQIIQTSVQFHCIYSLLIQLHFNKHISPTDLYLHLIKNCSTELLFSHLLVQKSIKLHQMKSSNSTAQDSFQS